MYAHWKTSSEPASPSSPPGLNLYIKPLPRCAARTLRSAARKRGGVSGRTGRAEKLKSSVALEPCMRLLSGLHCQGPATPVPSTTKIDGVFKLWSDSAVQDRSEVTLKFRISVHGA